MMETDADRNISISSICTIITYVGTLMSALFPDLPTNFTNLPWLSERAILDSKNISITSINNNILHFLPGHLIAYKSFDSITDPNEAVHFPMEFLHSLDPSGLSPQNLHLNIGSPVMLLCNIEPLHLCNRTSLAVKTVLPNLITATILTGCSKGEDVFIPRLLLTPSNMDILCPLRRVQFPLCVCIAMSINKSQMLSTAGHLG